MQWEPHGCVSFDTPAWHFQAMMRRENLCQICLQLWYRGARHGACTASCLSSTALPGHPRCLVGNVEELLRMGNFLQTRAIIK